MSKPHFNARNPLTVTFDQFHGISAPTPEAKLSPGKVINFRVGADGSLHKRCGARTLYTLPTSIRSHWSGYLNGSFYLYFLAGDSLYLGYTRQKYYQKIGTVSTSDGSASFFYLQGTLYLNDGEKLYLIDGDQVREAIGYVPLYGKDWDANTMGEVNEPFNILNSCVRITYHITTDSLIFLRVPHEIESVQAVFLNGVRLSDEEFQHNTAINTIDVSGLLNGDDVEVYLTFACDHSDVRRKFCSVEGSVFFGSAEKSRNFFFGGVAGDTVFCSEHVPPKELENARLVYNADPLYLPEGNEFQIPEQNHDIQALLCHKDHLLIFTEKDTWLGSIDSTGHTPLPSVLINSKHGCLSSAGSVLAKNDPITIDRNGLYLWQSTNPELTERDTVRISDALDFFLTPSDLSTASLYYDEALDELWLTLPSRNEVWICSMKRNEWFCFSGFRAERIFEADGWIGFYSGGTVSVFKPDLRYDMDPDGKSTKICAVYETPPLNFGTFQKKNLSHISFDTTGDGALFELTFRLDELSSSTCQTFDTQGRNYGTLPFRLRSGRFQNATLEISTENHANPIIYSLTLTAH